MRVEVVVRWPFRRSAVEEPARESVAESVHEAATLAWWFAGGAHARGLPVMGATDRVAAPLRLGEHGLHASRSVLASLSHAMSPVICRVRLGGAIAEGDDQLAATERTVLSIHDVRAPLREVLRRWISGALAAAGESSALDVDHRACAERARERAIRAEDRVRDAEWVLAEGAGRREGDARARAMGAARGARFAVREARGAAYAHEAAGALADDVRALARASELVIEALSELEAETVDAHRAIRARIDRELDQRVAASPEIDARAVEWPFVADSARARHEEVPEPRERVAPAVAATVVASDLAETIERRAVRGTGRGDPPVDSPGPILDVDPAAIVFAGAFSTISIEPPEKTRPLVPRRESRDDAGLPEWALAIHALCVRAGGVYRAWAIGGDMKLATHLQEKRIAPIAICVADAQSLHRALALANTDATLDSLRLGVAVFERSDLLELSAKHLALDAKLRGPTFPAMRERLAASIAGSYGETDLTRIAQWDDRVLLDMELRWHLWTSAPQVERAVWLEDTEGWYPSNSRGPKLLAVLSRDASSVESLLRGAEPDLGLVEVALSRERARFNTRAVEQLRTVPQMRVARLLDDVFSRPDVFAREWMLARPSSRDETRRRGAKP